MRAGLPPAPRTGCRSWGAQTTMRSLVVATGHGMLRLLARARDGAARRPARHGRRAGAGPRSGWPGPPSAATAVRCRRRYAAQGLRLRGGGRRPSLASRSSSRASRGAHAFAATCARSAGRSPNRRCQRAPLADRERLPRVSFVERLRAADLNPGPRMSQRSSPTTSTKRPGPGEGCTPSCHDGRCEPHHHSTSFQISGCASRLRFRNSHRLLELPIASSAAGGMELGGRRRLRSAASP